MGNVLQVEIDKSIILPESCDNMPPDLKQHLLITMTIACERYDCSWQDLRWAVKYDSAGNPYIKVKKA